MAQDDTIKLTSKSSCVSLSNRSYQCIVNGKMAGYAGIEHICRPKMQMECSDGTIRKITIPQLIVRASHCRPDLSGNKDLLHSYARSLKKFDRSWAAVMGRTDHDALKRMDMLSPVCHSRCEY